MFKFVLICLALCFSTAAAADETQEMAVKIISYTKEAGMSSPQTLLYDGRYLGASVRQATLIICRETVITGKFEGGTFALDAYSCAATPVPDSFDTQVCAGEYVRISSIALSSVQSNIYFDHCDDDGMFDGYSIKGAGEFDPDQTHAEIVRLLHNHFLNK